MYPKSTPEILRQPLLSVSQLEPTPSFSGEFLAQLLAQPLKARVPVASTTAFAHLWRQAPDAEIFAERFVRHQQVLCDKSQVCFDVHLWARVTSSHTACAWPRKRTSERRNCRFSTRAGLCPLKQTAELANARPEVHQIALRTVQMRLLSANGVALRPATHYFDTSLAST